MVRILIVDDQKIVREGIKILLEESVEIEIVGDASDAQEGLKQIELLQPDIVLLDIDMPKVSGLTLAKKISIKFPQVKTIMLSSHEDEEYVQKATENGAKGYLLKNVSTQELEWSIRLVSHGYSAIKSELLAKQSENHPIAEPNFDLDEDLRTAKEADHASTAVLSSEDRANLDKLEFLLARKEAEKKYSKFNQKKKFFFHQFRFTQIKKTVSSFEFRLLVFMILFCLSFLIFIALS